jgi:SAM-dependent methyltransferase
MLLGPIEDQQLDPRSCDLIVAFDVLEHLPDPVRTMTRCAELLRDDGLLVLQTPRRQAGVDFIQASSGRFRDMLIPEHLHLFSEASARHLLQRVGLSAVSMEQPIFDGDMVLVAGRRQFGRVSEAHVPGGWRFRRAEDPLHSLLSLDEEAASDGSVEARYRDADRDRERLRRIGELDALLRADRDRRAAPQDRRAGRAFIRLIRSYWRLHQIEQPNAG